MSQVTTQVSNERLANFRAVAEIFLFTHGTPDKDPTVSRLVEAVDKMFKKLKKKNEHYEDKAKSIRRSHALTDPKTHKLIVTNGLYEYTKEGAEKVEKELRELQYKKVDIRPEYVKKEDMPDTLKFEYNRKGVNETASDYEVRSAFLGFVIEPNGTDLDEDEDDEEANE